MSAHCFKYQIASSLFMEQWFRFSMRGAMVLRTNFGASKLELLLRAAVLFLPLYFLILCELWMKANRKNACRLTLDQFCWGPPVARLFGSCFQLQSVGSWLDKFETFQFLQYLTDLEKKLDSTSKCICCGYIRYFLACLNHFWLLLDVTMCAYFKTRIISNHIC